MNDIKILGGNAKKENRFLNRPGVYTKFLQHRHTGRKRFHTAIWRIFAEALLIWIRFVR